MSIRDKYLIIDQIGRGGMGIVFRAKHLAFGEFRAIKVVDSRLAEDRSFVRRFKAEAIIARKLQHSNAIRIDDLDSTEDGRPFIVMELVEGQSLKNLITHEGTLSVTRALNLACQVAEVLAAAHELGIVHRDIKPDNIIVSDINRADQVKVADFGIAKVREDVLNLGTAYTSTVTGMVIGTPQYLSPEQALGKQADQIDGRSDIYSLGVVLYEMLTGQLPFDADTPMGFLMHHLQSIPVPASLLRPDLEIPSEVSTLLAKMLEKDPGNRFARADDLVCALQHLQRGVFSGSLSLSVRHLPDLEITAKAGELAPANANVMGNPTVVEPTARKRNSFIWSSAAALLVLLLVFVSWCPSHLSDRAHPMSKTIPIASHGLNDEDIRSKIVNALSVLKDSAVVVEVRDRAVRLSGTVVSPEDQNRAYQIAAGTMEVQSVKNEIVLSLLRPEEEPSGVSHKVAPSASGKKLPLRTDEPSAPIANAKAADADIKRLIDAGQQATEDGNYKSAILFFQRALRANPGNGSAQTGLRQAIRAKQTEESVLQR